MKPYKGKPEPKKGTTITSIKKIRVINEDSGAAYEVSPDPDGLGLVEVTVTEGKEHVGRFSMPADLAIVVANALKETAAHIERNTPTEGPIPR